MNEKVQLAFLTLFSMTVFFCKLNSNGLANYDDCFYAEEAKEILKTGQWMILHYNGAAAYHNAPLFMWLMALSFKIFGLSVYAAKFPSALMGLLTVFLIYALGRFLFTSTHGFFAAFVLTTTYPFFKYARHAMLDVTLAFFVTLALLGLVLALRKDPKYFWLWGVAIGAAVLTKSAFGLFPLFITFLFLMLAGRWKIFSNLHFWGGVLAALGIGGAWVLSQYLVGGQDFINTHLKFIILGKISDDHVEAWYGHLGYFKDLLVFYWPWLPVTVFGLFLVLRGDLKNKEITLLLLLWSLTVLAVMSFMAVRYIWYLMQCLPTMALVAAVALEKWTAEPQQKVKALRGFMTAGLLAVVLLNFSPFPLDGNREVDTRVLSPYVKHFAEQGDKIIALRESYYGLNNALLFFSDHVAEPVYSDVQDVQREFDSKKPVLCIAHLADLDDLRKSLKGWYPVKYTGNLILISNQLLDTHDIQYWGGLWLN